VGSARRSGLYRSALTRPLDPVELEQPPGQRCPDRPPRGAVGRSLQSRHARANERRVPAAHKADKFRFEPRKFDAAGLTEQDSETVKPPRIAECPLQLEAKVTAIHEPATHPDGAYFRIAEAQVQRVHALSGVVKPGTSHIDPGQWRPLLYVFRHYFSTGKELARSFRAED
jgi:hypothetical protein